MITHSNEEFLKIQEGLSDYEDLQELRQAKEVEKNAPTVSLEEAKKTLGIWANHCREEDPKKKRDENNVERFKRNS